MGERKINSNQNRKRKMVSRIKWSEEMETDIFDYSKSALVSGKGFEKPTANEFYRKFLATANPERFNDVTLEKLVQHMKMIKNSYHVALNWRNQTGQGILSSDPEAVDVIKRELLKRCKQFERIDEILGDKPQFNPPYVHHSDDDLLDIEFSYPSALQEVNSENEVDFFGASYQPDSISPTAENKEHQSNKDKESPAGEVREDLTSEEKETASQPSVNVKTPISSENRRLKKKIRPSPMKCTVIAFESAMTLRADADRKRLEWETSCKEKELAERKEERERQLALDNARLQFEKEKWQEELQLKADAETRKFELEKLKIEKEAELAAKKLQQDFEIEKLKLISKQ